jgi:hypothetical protein
MLRTILYFIIVAAVFLNTNNAFGQLGNIFKNNKTSYTTLGIGGGSSHYLGDLAPYTRAYMALYSNVRWNGTINYQYHFNPKVSARVGFSYIRIFGNDETFGGSIADTKASGQRLRNLHFRNDMMEFALTGIYTFFPMDERRHKNQKLQWSPYIGAGIGIIGHNPKARGSIQNKNNGYLIEPNTDGKYVLKEWINLKNEGNNLLPDGSVKTYSSITPAFPIVLGIKTKINSNWILSVEGGLRLTLTDFLDDVGEYGYNLGSTSKISYRADEDYSAYSGKSRLELFRKFTSAPGSGDFYPSALSNLDVNSSTDMRGTKWKDSYIVTQITLNYIISDMVKCPPLKQ